MRPYGIMLSLLISVGLTEAAASCTTRGMECVCMGGYAQDGTCLGVACSASQAGGIYSLRGPCRPRHR
jgi:hypothetical protein